MKKLKKIPRFKNEDEEGEFWRTHDSTEYINWSKAERAYFPKLRPSSKHISIRLPERLFEQLRNIAHQKDIPYPVPNESLSCREGKRGTQNKSISEIKT